VRSVGAVLALLAILLQAVLPLADARWHAQQRAGLSAAAPAVWLTESAVARAHPCGDPPQAPAADYTCQLCIGMQGFGTALTTPTAPLAVPTRYDVIGPPWLDDTAPTAPRARPHQPRAPPIQA
jgi:hypothetical protein